GVIAAFGAATLVSQHDSFITWKPTVLYSLFATILIVSQLLLGRNLRMSFMGGQLTPPAPAWQNLNCRWPAFFIFSGSANLFVAFSGYFTESQWVNFKVFGSLILLIVFVVGQSLWLSRYMKDEPPA